MKRTVLWIRTVILVFGAAFWVAYSCGCSSGVASGRPYGRDYVKKAEKYAAKKEYDQAISAYHQHMQARLNVPSRPDWENPYFYALLIGDLELERGQVEAALKAYTDAYDNEVEKTLVADRMRALGLWYEKHGEYQKALDHLSKYKDLDPFLFNLVLDRIAKELSSQEGV
jgi:tetratricopeptide (TPR) repeat protein